MATPFRAVKMPTSQLVQVDARPSPLVLDPRETALVLVHMQQLFFGAGGMWDRAGVDLSEAPAVIAATARVLAAARQAGMPIVYLTVDPDRPAPNQRLWTEERAARWRAAASITDPRTPSRVLPDGIKETDILAELSPGPDDAIVVTGHSGFYDTPLHDLLQGMGVTTLVLTGGTTSVCVESTLRDAWYRNYACLLVTDCTLEPVGHHFPRTNREATFLLVESWLGWLADSVAFVQALTKHEEIAESALSPR